MSKLNNNSNFEPDFGIKKFHTKKFENSDEDSIIATNPIESVGINQAFSAFCSVIPVDDCFPEEDNE
ncbi:MAG: hypothetical protein LBF88_03825 [Planctomycetaceae bacterium]|nr:hypothetical protein [Planctomycetaceae bacterium]